MYIAITGASSGIGEALALALAASGHRLFLTGRDEGRLASIASRTGGSTSFPCDLSTLAGARTLGARLANEPLDVLVHNAGVLPTKRELTSDGFEVSFATNHLAPFVINEALKARPPRRIVQVSAGLYALGKVDLVRDPTGEAFHPFRTYGTSKLWNLVGSFEWVKAVTGVTLNAVHPGVIRSRLGALPGWKGALLDAVKWLWGRPEAGARGPAFLATDPSLEHTSGVYFDVTTPRPLRANATLPGLGAQVLARTRELVAR
jgi:NAD(P)-dependent dehydrogenase (short-subunit alcohol dehydrogenase family)